LATGGPKQPNKGTGQRGTKAESKNDEPPMGGKQKPVGWLWEKKLKREVKGRVANFESCVGFGRKKKRHRNRRLRRGPKKPSPRCNKWGELWWHSVKVGESQPQLFWKKNCSKTKNAENGENGQTTEKGGTRMQEP